VFDESYKICEFGKIREIHELQENHSFLDHCSGTGYAIGQWAVRNTVLCIACFAYSLLLVIVVVPLLLNCL